MVSSKQAVDEAIIEEMDKACLEGVLSIAEAMALYNKSRPTIVDLIKAGRLIGRQARFGSMWFVTKRSCDERWPDYGRS